FGLAPPTSRPGAFAGRARSNADMYLVIAGSRSARAAASRSPLELVIAVLTRSAPNTVAKISGTNTIARTLYRTGQLLSDHAGGRLRCCAGGALAPGTSAASDA